MGCMWNETRAVKMKGNVWNSMRVDKEIHSYVFVYHSLFPCRKLYFVFPPLLSMKQRLKQMSWAALIFSV